MTTVQAAIVSATCVIVIQAHWPLTVQPVYIASKGPLKADKTSTPVTLADKGHKDDAAN